MENLKILELGPGERPLSGEVTTVDFNKNFKPTIVHDLNKFPWPLSDASFDVIYASHVLEHFKDTVRAMEEIYRIAKPGAKVIIRVPHFSSRAAWINPTHYRAFSVSQFDYFDKKVPENYGDCNFKVIKKELRYSRPDVNHGFTTKILTSLLNFLANSNQNACERIWCYLVGGFSEAYVELEAIK